MPESAAPFTRARAKHRLAQPRKRRGIRALVVGSGALAGAVVLGLVGTGGTYALWGGNAQVNASVISSGSTGVTINGEQSHLLSGLSASALGPGDSVVAALTVANTGSTPVAVTVSKSVVTAQTKSLANSLMMRFVPVASAADCVAGIAGGTSARIAALTTTAPVVLAVGASQVFCLQLSLDADAPSTVQGGAASFALTIDAAQKAP